MSGFTKLSASIITSSIWQEDDATRLVWITMLAMANPHGVVEASIPGLANIANVEVEECVRAIRKLLEPDVYSRTAEHEGRRIVAIEGGWRILNYEKYRNEGGPFSLSADEQPTKIYFVQCGDKIKIGRSKNPWARLDALKTSMPEEPTLIGYYEAFVADERDLQLKWDHLHVNREWFRLTDELADDIERLTGNRPVATTALPVATGSYGSTTVATTTQKSEDRSQKTDNNTLSASADSSPKRSQKRTARTYRINFDYATNQFTGITNKDWATWSEAFPAVDVRLEAKRAAIWLRDNPTKRKKNVQAFLSRWFGRCQERGGNQAPRSNFKATLERWAKKHEGEENDIQ